MRMHCIVAIAPCLQPGCGMQRDFTGNDGELWSTCDCGTPWQEPNCCDTYFPIQKATKKTMALTGRIIGVRDRVMVVLAPPEETAVLSPLAGSPPIGPCTQFASTKQICTLTEGIARSKHYPVAALGVCLGAAFLILRQLLRRLNLGGTHSWELILLENVQ